MRGIASIANAVAPASASAFVVCGAVSGARKPIRIEPWPRPRIASGSGGAIVTTMSLRQTSPASLRDRRAGLGELLVAEQRALARAALDEHVEALGLQLADDLRHERDAMLAGGGLLRDSDPHRGAGKLSDPDCEAAARLDMCADDAADRRRDLHRRPRDLQSGAADSTVNLTRIYTKLGDGGETHLGDMSRVSKLHPRVEAYGTIDELNAQIGVALLADGDARPLRRVARARAERPARRRRGPLGARPLEDEARERLRVTPDYTAWLEQACDEVNEKLPPLRSFVIPGGTPAAAHLHVCRTVCRRAERRTIAVEDANPEAVRYLNRLSDLLFILSRAANESGAEHLWDARRARRRRHVLGSRPAAGRATLGGAQRRDRERHPQRGQQDAADHVARHVPGEHEQRDARGQHVGGGQRPRRTGAGGAARRARHTARAPSRRSRARSATRRR